MNSRDMCMIDHLDDLMDAGVDCLKIEGRAKSAYYAAIVTGAYRHVLDDAAAGRPIDRCGGTKWSMSATGTIPRAFSTANRVSSMRMPGTSVIGRSAPW